MLAASPASRVAWLVLLGAAMQEAAWFLIPWGMQSPCYYHHRCISEIWDQSATVEWDSEKEPARRRVPAFCFLCHYWFCVVLGKQQLLSQPPPAPLLTGWENEWRLCLPHTPHAMPCRLALKTFVFFFHPWHPETANPEGFLGSLRIPTVPPNHTGFQRFP